MAPDIVNLLVSPKEYTSICKICHIKHKARQDSTCAATFRTTCRSFTTTYALILAFDVAVPAALGRKSVKESFRIAQRNAIRSGLSFSTIFLSHRFIIAFLVRFQQIFAQYQPCYAQGRSWRCLQTLCSAEYFPPIVAGVVSGSALIIHPTNHRRVAIAIYLFTRAAEGSYTFLNNRGFLPKQPWWFGSWMLFPFASGQLLHAMSLKSFILGFSDIYVKKRPVDYPANLPWPSVDTILDNVAEISRKNYPKFESPVLRPGVSVIPPLFEEISPVLNLAHPNIKFLSCALLHPENPSCTKTVLEFYARELLSVSKFMFIFYTLVGLLRYKLIKKDPSRFVMIVLHKIAAASAFVTLSIGTSWTFICAFQRILPGDFLPWWRFSISGFIAGMFAFIDKEHGGSRFLSAARLSLVSIWKIVEKRNKKFKLKCLDVYLFAASLGLVMALFHSSPSSFPDSFTRKSLNALAGNSWVDPVKRKGCKDI